jgi:hypothetical protein
MLARPCSRPVSPSEGLGAEQQHDQGEGQEDGQEEGQKGESQETSQLSADSFSSSSNFNRCCAAAPVRARA